MAPGTSFNSVRLEIEKDIAILKMVNEENKWNLSFLHDLQRGLDQVESNPRVKSLVIIGEGKFFSYGLDLPWIAQQTSKDVLIQFFTFIDHLATKIINFPMPTIAALNGHAYGMGAVLAMCCDYRVMRKGQGWFNFPETKLRLKFSEITLEIIKLKLTKFKTFRDAVLYGKRYTAEEALSADIVDEAVDKQDLLPTALRIGREIAGNGLDRETVRVCKDKIFGAPLRAARERDRQNMSEKDTAARFEAFKQGANLVSSKM